MEVGYFTMPMHPPGSDLTKTLEDDLQQIVALDKLGYKEAWIGEHFTTAWENIPAPDLFIAQALPLTQNIILGTGVTCMPNHNPFVVAHRIAQLDHMARGRFHWGVGSGGFPGDFEVFGYVPATGDHRIMTQAAIDLVLQIWDDPKPGLYESKYWSFTIPEAPGRHRPALPHQAVPAAAPAHRRGRCVGEVGHADARGRTWLVAHEHQPGAPAHPEDPLERGGRRRGEHGSDGGPLDVAHRARGLRGGRRPRRRAATPLTASSPATSRSTSAGCSPRSAAWAG